MHPFSYVTSSSSNQLTISLLTQLENKLIKGSVKALCIEWVSLAKITPAIKRKISLVSQAVKLMSHGQIAAIGEDLQNFYSFCNTEIKNQKTKIKIRPIVGPVSHASTLSKPDTYIETWIV